MEETALRRTWTEIDLDALAHNYQQARRRIGPKVKYLGVVKADAYGHGAVQVSRKLEQLGADYLAVSSLDEARELRRGGVGAPILILGHTPPEMVPQLIEYGITQALYLGLKSLMRADSEFARIVNGSDGARTFAETGVLVPRKISDADLGAMAARVRLVIG